MTDENENVWNVEEKSKININGTVVEIEGEITAEKIKQVAREHGINKFFVKDVKGNILLPSDFPRVGEIIIEEYEVW